VGALGCGGAGGGGGGGPFTHHFDAKLHAELGGESIDVNHHALLAMIDRFGLGTERRPPLKPYDSTIYRGGVREPVAAFVAGRGGRVLTDYLAFSDQVAARAAGVDPLYPERAPNAAELDAQSLDAFITSAGMVPEAEFLVRTAYRGEYNAEARDLSMLFIAQQANGEDTGLFGAETRRITGGNSQLPARMAAALGDRVRLGTPVTRIDRRANGVTVHAGQARWTADYAVLALPAMALRRVRFDPVLPAAAAAMVHGLDLGAAAKVVTEYEVPFWTAEGVSGFTLTDLPFHIAWSPTDSYAAAHGLLSQFITGDAAVAAAAQAPADRIATFAAQLGQVYAEAGPLRTARAATMAWANEPYTGGGYAIFRPGQMAPFWPVLRDGVGRLLFAGEHTEVLIGYMESAVRSGHRIAARIGRP
jgi:monoamine oxidase